MLNCRFNFTTLKITQTYSNEIDHNTSHNDTTSLIKAPKSTSQTEGFTASISFVDFWVVPSHRLLGNMPLAINRYP